MKALSRLGKVVELSVRRALAIIFPDACVGCEKFGALLCDVCADRVRFQVISVEMDISAGCFYQDSVVKNTIHHLKFRHRSEALGPLEGKIAASFAGTIKKFGLGNANILLIPIPLWHARKRERGFNQSEIIARIIERSRPEKFSVDESMLIRTRYIRAQTETTSKKERTENIKGCFRCAKDDLGGKTVVVIDDIVTTGATMHEAIRVLKKAGAKEVYGFALAH